MNERIKQLAEQAELPLLDVDGNCKYGDTYFSKEKFAELIVLECVEVAHPKLTDVGEWAAVMRLVQKRLKQHFGVEE